MKDIETKEIKENDEIPEGWAIGYYSGIDEKDDALQRALKTKVICIPRDIMLEIAKTIEKNRYYGNIYGVLANPPIKIS